MLLVTSFPIGHFSCQSDGYLLTYGLVSDGGYIDLSLFMTESIEVWFEVWLFLLSALFLVKLVEVRLSLIDDLLPVDALSCKP